MPRDATSASPAVTAAIKRAIEQDRFRSRPCSFSARDEFALPHKRDRTKGALVRVANLWVLNPSRIP